MPPKGRHETREIGRNSKIERAVSPSNGQFGAAEAVDQTFLRYANGAVETVSPLAESAVSAAMKAPGPHITSAMSFRFHAIDMAKPALT